jgi:hypothetical protein
VRLDRLRGLTLLIRTTSGCLVDTVAVDVVVGPGGPVNGHPGGVGLGVEGARGGVGLVRVDGHCGVPLSLEVGAPGLVGLVPVAAHGGVIPAHIAYSSLYGHWNDYAVQAQHANRLVKPKSFPVPQPLRAQIRLIQQGVRHMEATGITPRKKAGQVEETHPEQRRGVPLYRAVL